MLPTNSNGVTSYLVILLKVSVNPTTNGFNFFIHHVVDCTEVNIAVQVRLCVAMIANDSLISSRIDSQRLNRRGLDVSDLKEHVSVK